MKRCNNCGWFNLDSAVCCEKCEEDSFEIEQEETIESHSESEFEPVPEPVPATEPVPEPETPVVVPALDPAPVAESVSVPDQVDDPEPVHEQQPVKNRISNATVAFGAASVPTSEQRKKLTATVMDASAVLETGCMSETVQCPKCCYPITGGSEYCPNCGATVKKKAEVKPLPQPVVQQVEQPASEPRSLKATVSTVMITSDGEEKEEPKPINATVRIVPHTEVKKAKADLKATVRDIPDELISENMPDFRLVPVASPGESPIELRVGHEVVISGIRYFFEKC